MHGIGIAKEVVEVAQDLLIGAYEEHANVIGVLTLQGVYGQIVRHMAIDHEVGYLAIGVAGHVLNGTGAIGFLIQTLDRHDGEDLVDGPRVGQRLEEGEVAEVFIGKQLRQATELIGGMLQVVGYLIHLAHDAPVEALYLGACLQIYQAMAEEVECLIAYLLGIVPGFEQAALSQGIPDLIEFLKQFVLVLAYHLIVVPRREGGGFIDLEHQHGVMGCQGASALGDDVGVWDIVLVAGVYHGGYGIVDVLLDGVVHAALAG